MRPQILFPLFADTKTLSGIGQKTKNSLDRLCGKRLIDVLWHFPKTWIHRRYASSIKTAIPGQFVIVKVTIGKHTPPPRMGKIPYRIDAFDNSDSIQLVFFKANTAYIRATYPEGEVFYISGKVEVYGNSKQILHPDFVEKTLDSIEVLQPVYGQSEGITNKTLTKIVKQAIGNIPPLPEWLDETMIAQNRWQGFAASLTALHTPQHTERLTENTVHRERLAYDELLANQLAIAIARYVRQLRKTEPVVATHVYRTKILRNLPFTLTDAQHRAIADIDADMGKNTPMMRLLQGDVGTGKTVVALLACLNAVENNRQALLVAPTEILAHQHFDTIQKFLQGIEGIEPILLTGQKKGKERKKILESIVTGKANIVVGTHALFQAGILYKDIAFIAIDEQHRFGVLQKIALHEKGNNPHVLTMTATPIPRTLLMTAFGDMQSSILKEKPKNRKSIDTRVMPIHKGQRVVNALKRILQRGTQVYWICPSIGDCETLDLTAAKDRYAYLSDILGDSNVALIHGKMKTDEKYSIMEKFLHNHIKVLVATTVVEVGIDVPNASVMIIEQAERFGLSQLHQLRGRIGRGEKAATCILLYKKITPVIKERLHILQKYQDGFKIAEADLQLRGPGDILGTKQSGLPEWKVADLYRDKHILTTAQKEAEHILQKDPHLTSNRGRNLRILLHIFERDKAIHILRKSG